MGSDYLTPRCVSLSGNAAIVESAALSGGGRVAACGSNRNTNNHEFTAVQGVICRRVGYRSLQSWSHRVLTIRNFVQPAH